LNHKGAKEDDLLPGFRGTRKGCPYTLFLCVLYTFAVQTK